MDNMELMPVAAEPEVITHKSFEELDRDLQDELEREAEGFVKIGYMLKIFRDTTILQDTQYKDVYDYAMKRFHLDKSQVSRFTRINDKFSEGGYSEKLQDKYKGFGSSKLAIMLQFPDSIAEEITQTFSKSEFMEEQMKRIIETFLITCIYCVVWEALEIILYGKKQYRTVDDIMVLLFIPVIYIATKQ